MGLPGRMGTICLGVAWQDGIVGNVLRTMGTVWGLPGRMGTMWREWVRGIGGDHSETALRRGLYIFLGLLASEFPFFTKHPGNSRGATATVLLYGKYNVT